MKNMNKINKVVLAFSGGLDTSVILKWLQDSYQCEIVTFTADIGQGEEIEPARTKAEKLGIKEIFIEDLREEFVRDFVFPMFRANTIYEGEYLLGTSIARPLIAKRQIEIAKLTKSDAVSHGSTGKGNDQVRFELGYYALQPDIHVIAPWREWDLTSREKLLQYAKENNIPIEMKKKNGSPYSMDANLLHISYEGRILEDPSIEPDEAMWRWSVSPENAPNEAEYIDIEKSPFKSRPFTRTVGGKGTLVIFHRGIWHQLPNFKSPGREILMMQYFQKDSPSKDHLIRNSFLQDLSERQREVFLSHSSPSSSLPTLLELGSEPDAMGVYKIPTWKMLLYLLRYKLFSKV